MKVSPNGRRRVELQMLNEEVEVEVEEVGWMGGLMAIYICI